MKEFDPGLARYERYVPLTQLVFSLECIDDNPPCNPWVDLLERCSRHITAAHLKTYGYDNTPTIDAIPTTETIIADGVEQEAEVLRFRSGHSLDNYAPLIDVREFAAWFAEYGGPYLKLPDGFAAEISRPKKRTRTGGPREKTLYAVIAAMAKNIGYTPGDSSKAGQGKLKGIKKHTDLDEKTIREVITQALHHADNE